MTNIEDKAKEMHEYMKTPKAKREHEDNELHRGITALYNLYTSMGIPENMALIYAKLNYKKVVDKPKKK